MSELMRVLDLGCGAGDSPKHLKLGADCEVYGIDRSQAAVEQARTNYPNRHYHVGRGEDLPYPAESFDQVIANVSLPYMHIPKALAEVRRVLKSNGTALFTIHPPWFTFLELKQTRHLRPAIFRLFVLLNGL